MLKFDDSIKNLRCFVRWRQSYALKRQKVKLGIFKISTKKPHVCICAERLTAIRLYDVSIFTNFA